MLRLRCLALAGCVAVLGVVGAGAQENKDLKDILRKAITAHGGEKALTKFQAATSKYKGTLEIMGMTLKISGENSFQKPDKLRTDITLDIMNNSIQIIQVYNGKKMWVSTMGQVKEVDDEKALKEMREGLLIEGAASLVDFLKKPYELSAVGDVKVKDTDAIGIRVSKKGQRDISLFFDKKTHLIVKTEMRVYDSMSAQEYTQEKFISDYKKVGDLMTPQRVVVHKDGNPFLDLEITEARPMEKLDDATFAMP